MARLSALVGSAFADAALAAIAAAGLERTDVALVGSHGQTIWHDPRGARGGVGCTLQIGEAAEIAERTGLPVWHDFRPADVAAGGEGAPLVPYVDWVLFTLADRWTVCLNLGGIANVTLLPPAAGIEDVVAFDTGPGNMALDHLAERLLGRTHDEGGEAAAAGRGRRRRGSRPRSPTRTSRSRRPSRREGSISAAPGRRRCSGPWRG